MYLVRARCPRSTPQRPDAVGRGRRLDAPVAPAWGFLGVALVLGMAAWAVGLFELPDYRRLSDWIGGLTIVTILVVWVRRNGAALACRPRAPRDGDERLEIRLIRSRRPPLPDLGGPEIKSPRRRISARRPFLP